MTTLYVVTAGEYSDYHIEAVYLNEAHANRHVEIENGPDTDDCRVEEYDLIETEPVGYVTYYRSVNVMPDGTTQPWDSYSRNRVQTEPTAINVYDSGAYVPSHRRRFIRVEGTDLTQVEKVLAERVAKAQAEAVEHMTETQSLGSEGSNP